jgi:hypothetical protein
MINNNNNNNNKKANRKYLKKNQPIKMNKSYINILNQSELKE